MSRFKDEELAILHELGIDDEYLNDKLKHHYQTGSSALQIVLHTDFYLEECSNEKLEKCMLALISLCDNVSETIAAYVATRLNFFREFACPTERVFRKMLERCVLNDTGILVKVMRNVHTRLKNALKHVLESEPPLHELKRGLTAVPRIYIENTFAYDMILEAF